MPQRSPNVFECPKFVQTAETVVLTRDFVFENTFSTKFSTVLLKTLTCRLPNVSLRREFGERIARAAGQSVSERAWYDFFFPGFGDG
jgi:hypothetical protein